MDDLPTIKVLAAFALFAVAGWWFTLEYLSWRAAMAARPHTCCQYCAVLGDLDDFELDPDLRPDPSGDRA